MLARTINASWNQANNKTFGPGHIYRYQIRILHIKHFYPQLTDKNGNQMENLGSLTLAGLVETGFAGNVIVSDWFWPRQLPTIWPGVGIWWKAFLWNCGVGPDSTLHWRIMRALPPVSCINYNRPGCSATRWSTVCFCEVQCSTVQPIEQCSLCSAVLFSAVLCSSVLCSVSVSCIHYSGSRSAIMIYSPSHPHTTTTCQLIHLCFSLYTCKHVWCTIYLHGYTCVERNTSCQVIHLFFFAPTHQHQYHYLSTLIGHVTSWSEALCLWVSTSASKKWIWSSEWGRRNNISFILELNLKPYWIWMWIKVVHR